MDRADGFTAFRTGCKYTIAGQALSSVLRFILKKPMPERRAGALRDLLQVKAQAFKVFPKGRIGFGNDFSILDLYRDF